MRYKPGLEPERLKEMRAHQCTNREPRRGHNTDDRPFCADQCVECGRRGGGHKLSAYPDAPWFDFELQRLWALEMKAGWDKWREDTEEADAVASGDWWDRYDAHIASERWRNTRRRVFKRDGCTCQICLNAKATQVHHLDYSRVPNEYMTDLLSVCDACHIRLHPDGGGRPWER